MSPQLIAHRGYPARFPENTLVGYQAAVAAGATWLETDIQFSRDGVPVLYHDADLQRTSNRPGRIADFTFHQLAYWDAAETGRFGEQFRGEPILRLRDFVHWIDRHEPVHVMIELKQETLARFGVETVLRRVLQDMDVVVDRCVLISKNLAALCHARSLTEIRTGWVLPEWTETNRELVEDHPQDFLIVKHSRVPSGHNALWRGTWHWVVYAIDDPDVACQQYDRGIEYVETNAIGDMLTDGRFRNVDHHRTR